MSGKEKYYSLYALLEALEFIKNVHMDYVICFMLYIENVEIQVCLLLHVCQISKTVDYIKQKIQLGQIPRKKITKF